MRDGHMPVLAILLTVLGLAPFIICGLAALGTNPDVAGRMLEVLIGYAALALSFAGGIHWGFELQSVPLSAATSRARLVLGILPLLLGWIALVLPLVVAPWVSLILLIVA
jgi:hypothetical protein